MPVPAGQCLCVPTVLRPWWQVTRSVRQAYLLGGLFLLLGALQLSLFTGSSPLIRWLHLGTGLLFILLAALCLTSGVLLQRRRRDVKTAGGEPPRPYLEEAGLAEIDALLARGKRIQAVRRVRELTGMSRVDARELVGSRRP